MKEIIIEQKHSGQRVDKYLERILPEASKSFLYKMMRKKNIVINDKKIQGNEILNTGDSVKIWFSDETFEKFSGNNSFIVDTSEYIRAFSELKGINIEYEDENFLILNKPAGILSQKAENNDISINEWIIGYCLQSNCIEAASLKEYKPSVVNRLDRNTSGLVLAGKNVFALNTLGKMVKNREISKYYLTYVWGELTGEDVLEGYHLKDSDKNKVTIIGSNSWKNLDENDKNNYVYVKTAYKALGSYAVLIDEQKLVVTKIEVDLITGKSHQIRAHLASIGHELVGDSKYGIQSLNKKLGLRYQLLHAYRLVFPNDDKLGNLSGREIICQPSNQEDFEAHFLKN